MLETEDGRNLYLHLNNNELNKENRDINNKISSSKKKYKKKKKIKNLNASAPQNQVRIIKSQMINDNGVEFMKIEFEDFTDINFNKRNKNKNKKMNNKNKSEINYNYHKKNENDTDEDYKHDEESFSSIYYKHYGGNFNRAHSQHYRRDKIRDDFDLEEDLKYQKFLESEYKRINKENKEKNPNDILIEEKSDYYNLKNSNSKYEFKKMRSSYEFLQALQEAKKISLIEAKNNLSVRERMEERISKFELFLNDNTDNEGDCLFDSVANQLELNGIVYLTKEDVRARVARWLVENKDFNINKSGETLETWLKVTQQKTWDEYVENMSKPKVWGDEIALKAITEVFGVRIILFSSTVSETHFISEHLPKNQSKDKDLLPTLKICHFLEYHYQSLITEKQRKDINNELVSRARRALLNIKNIKKNKKKQMKFFVTLYERKMDTLNEQECLEIIEQNSPQDSFDKFVDLLGDFSVFDLHRVNKAFPYKKSLYSKLKLKLKKK
eukprot:TRINITY_DN4867_c0_g2_i1.p1 TRINITY_DN4867_c0_g2~~TRINITY_DN4867_c0_g2_i1.p1  ORF type:complete len:498 (+),score=165.32 TRINITY_DN4867_c0_g2_i1:122-1615(+)